MDGHMWQIVVFALGLLLTWFLVRDIRSGKTMAGPMAVSRKKSPFLYWLGIAALLLAAGLSLGAGLQGMVSLGRG